MISFFQYLIEAILFPRLIPQKIMNVIKKNNGKLNNDIACPDWYKNTFINKNENFLNTAIEFHNDDNELCIHRVSKDAFSLYRLDSMTINGNSLEVDMARTKMIMDKSGNNSHFIEEDGKNTAKILDDFLNYALTKAETTDDVVNAFVTAIKENNITYDLDD